MARCKLMIVEDNGNLLSRAIHYIKADWVTISVVITNLYTDESWTYKEFHDALPEEGIYLLEFYVEDRKVDSLRLTIDENSPDVIFFVLKWSNFTNFLSRKQFTDLHSFEEYTAKRSMSYIKSYVRR